MNNGERCGYGSCVRMLVGNNGSKNFFEIYDTAEQVWKKICMVCKHMHFFGELSPQHHNFFACDLHFLPKTNGGENIERENQKV